MVRLCSETHLSTKHHENVSSIAPIQLEEGYTRRYGKEDFGESGTTTILSHYKAIVSGNHRTSSCTSILTLKSNPKQDREKIAIMSRERAKENSERKRVRVLPRERTGTRGEPFYLYSAQKYVYADVRPRSVACPDLPTQVRVPLHVIGFANFRHFAQPSFVNFPWMSLAAAQLAHLSVASVIQCLV